MIHYKTPKSKRKESLVRAGATGTAAFAVILNLYCQSYDSTSNCEGDKWKKRICMHNIDESPERLQTPTNGSPDYPYQHTVTSSTSTASGAMTTTTTTL